MEGCFCTYIQRLLSRGYLVKYISISLHLSEVASKLTQDFYKETNKNFNSCVFSNFKNATILFRVTLLFELKSS